MGVAKIVKADLRQWDRFDTAFLGQLRDPIVSSGQDRAKGLADQV